MLLHLWEEKTRIIWAQKQNRYDLSFDKKNHHIFSAPKVDFSIPPTFQGLCSRLGGQYRFCSFALYLMLNQSLNKALSNTERNFWNVSMGQHHGYKCRLQSLRHIQICPFSFSCGFFSLISGEFKNYFNIIGKTRQREFFGHTAWRNRLNRSKVIETNVTFSHSVPGGVNWSVILSISVNSAYYTGSRHWRF